IHFAHRTFRWSNEAQGRAAVHCVIIGFGREESRQLTIFDYENVSGQPHALNATNINPYLVDAPNLVLMKRERPYHFGVLSSVMHMAWMRAVCGRMKSDYQYSVGIVYNNFTWPEAPSDKQKDAVEEAAQEVLAARQDFPENSLADLYDPLTMPTELVKAHQRLDKVVEVAYGYRDLKTDAARVAFL